MEASFISKLFSAFTTSTTKNKLSTPINNESSAGFPASSAKSSASSGSLAENLDNQVVEANPSRTRASSFQIPPQITDTPVGISPLKAIQEALTFAPNPDSTATPPSEDEGQVVGQRLTKNLQALSENINNFTQALNAMPPSTQRDALLAKTLLLKAAHAYFPKDASELIKMRQWLSEQNVKIKDAILIFLHSSHTNGANKVGLDLAKSAKAYAQPLVILPESDGDVPKNLHQEGIPTAVISPKQLGAEGYQQEVCDQSAAANLVVLNTLMNFQLTEPLKKEGNTVLGIVHEGLPVQEDQEKTKEALENFIQNTFKRDDFNVDQLIAVFNQIDAVIVPCQSELENYTTLAPEHTHDKFKPILNGVSLQLADQTKAELTPQQAREAMGIHPDDFVILQLATFYPRKSNRTTIAATANLINDWKNHGKQGPKPTALLIGGRISKAQEAQYISEMVSDIQSKGLKANLGPAKLHSFTENGKTQTFSIPEFIKPDEEGFETGEYDVILLPVMDQDFCLKAHRAASVHVCPSRSELLPLSILESMAMGVPQVASNIAGIPEVVKSDKNGYLIEPADEQGLTQSLSKLIDAPEKHSQLGLEARASVEDKHTMQNMLEAYQETIKTLV